MNRQCPPTAEVGFDKYDQTSFVRGCVPRDRSLLGISPTDENGTFDVLVATFENDWIIGRFVAVDDEFLVISIAEVRNLGRFDVVLPLQRYGSPERNVPGSVPCNVARGDLPRTVVVQFPFRGVDDRAVLPSDTLPLRMEVVSIVQPAMLLLEPSCATQYPALSVV